MSITITPKAREKLVEVLAKPDNVASKLRVVFEGFG